MAPAGTVMVPQSTSASAGRYDILPYTRSRTASPADLVRTFVAPSTAASAGGNRRVTAQFDVITTYGNLKRQTDGGKHLVIDTKSGAMRANDVFHSHPADAADAGTAVDFPTHLEMTLDHNVDTSLMVQTPVRALASESEHVFPGSQTKENPHGNIALRFPLGSKTAQYTRTVEPGVLNFIEAFPGQTAEDADKWVSTINNKPDSKLLRVKPASAVAYFYNQRMTDAKDYVTEAMADPKLDTVVVSATAADQALADMKTAVGSKINYSNLSDKNQVAFKIGLAPRTYVNERGVGTHTSMKFADAYKHTAAYAKTRTAAAGNAKPSDYLAKADNHVERESNVELRGTMAIDFYHVDKNFKLAAAAADA
jgi:hypothetical protein